MTMGQLAEEAIGVGIPAIETCQWSWKQNLPSLEETLRDAGLRLPNSGIFA